VDLDGAKSSQIVNYKILEQIASQTTLKIDFGGGLKSDADLKIAFDSGANQITGGSIAIKNRALFENGFKNTVLIKLYLVRTPTMKRVAISGWLEESDEDLIPLYKDIKLKAFMSFVLI
jgi:phosphoribosylformimino-5-aminoimidazole carboxamide ribotide isomerase